MVLCLTSVSLAKLKPALQMMSSSERKREFQLRDLMLSRTSSSISSLNIQCETNQRQTHSIQARVRVSISIKHGYPIKANSLVFVYWSVVSLACVVSLPLLFRMWTNRKATKAKLKKKNTTRYYSHLHLLF